MDDQDNGMYKFDPNFPPFFVKPPDHLKEPIKRMMNDAIPNYLKECSKQDYHYQALLDSGLDAGEAGWLCQKETNHRRTHQNNIINNDWLFEQIKNHLPIDFEKNKDWESVLRKKIGNQVFTMQYKRQVSRTIREFLKDIGVNVKGLRRQLNPLMVTIQNHVC